MDFKAIYRCNDSIYNWYMGAHLVRFLWKNISNTTESENCSQADRARLEHLQPTTKINVKHWKKQLKQIMFLPAPSKGWCLNPKGSLSGTPYHPFGTPSTVLVPFSFPWNYTLSFDCNHFLQFIATSIHCYPHSLLPYYRDHLQRDPSETTRHTQPFDPPRGTGTNQRPHPSWAAKPLRKPRRLGAKKSKKTGEILGGFLTSLNQRGPP